MRYLAVCLTGVFGATLLAGPKTSPDLDRLKSGAGTVDVIVTYKTRPADEHKNKIEKKGGKIKADLSLINGIAYTIPTSLVDDLSRELGRSPARA